VELLVKETCNAVLTASRRGTITKSTFDRVIDATIRLASINVKMFPQTGLMQSAVQVAYESRLTVYDSLYLSLAQALKVPLLSLDTQQAEVARKMGLKVVKA
jgi:predicted nucleic acid-binding protein